MSNHRNDPIKARREEIQAWLSEAIPSHQRLMEVLVPLIEGLIKQEQIQYLSVEGRTKSIESASEKIRRKQYKDPRSQITDLTGIRIITYFDSQVKQIVNVIRTAFEVDEANSFDKSNDLGMDKIGYRSVHFVCTLGNKRKSLPEFKGIGDLKFEIQVRTVLQHAWAELAHDRAYKFPGVLPPDLQRKLNLYAGMLEIADAAFDDIASKVDLYRAEISSVIQQDSSISQIDSINVKTLIERVAASYNFKIPLEGDVDAKMIEEMKNFGIRNLKDFEILLTNSAEPIFSDKENNYYVGIIRDVMMLDNIDKYFRDAWKNSWGGLDSATWERLKGKYGADKVVSVLDEYDIDVVDYEEDD